MQTQAQNEQQHDIDKRYLSVHLNGRAYGIAVNYVKEIIAYTRLTRLPMTPAYIRGILNLRGSIIPIIDLGLRLNVGESNTSENSCIVITEVMASAQQKTTLGILVDDVNDVLLFEPEQLETAPPFGNDIPQTFIQYVVQMPKSFLTVLAVEQVLSVSELALPPA